MTTYEHEKVKGNSFFQEGNYIKAIECYNDCILIDPDEPVAYSNKAMSLIKLGENEKAIRVCNVALTKIDPDKQLHEAIGRKIKYRINVAKDAIDKAKQTLQVQTNGSFNNITIQEVDQLPGEFVGL
ncbi:similar to Saccharomyces cerevisiae YCR060W TAH1 HSP90 cofactor [Maudiozyma barnettii]|uniref:Similar to Saccharomyces cerevisiae YCR060W TAH1 HSP90 cofactor n=1 Tax=Maudiozyma barnettii TaxID=61262 RepID=A0A8H2VBK4_9SACH|nr:Tah1p [Kazachstania barnettii]CAB4252270.1 similar to Saccharomyces cerevisiae YCR060W TAH1 HSP90 cofactor [Kazachstania barnettii]CAD1778959.1 similar to Saccharomyces cerevisiae YCR060W TAH1 HSP90 cofactor [Kazachstania barnettii]